MENFKTNRLEDFYFDKVDNERNMKLDTNCTLFG